MVASLLWAGVFCDHAIADPDISVVRASVGSGKAQLTAVGRTRADLVLALVEGLKECDVTADGITVGKWLRLPKQRAPESGRLVITVCASPSIEGNEHTVYIAVTPGAPLTLVAAVTNKLRSCGMTDVRLLSDETIGTIVSESTATDTPAAKTRSTDHARDATADVVSR